MASELRVNKINSRTGFGTITVSETGQDLVGVTTIQNLTTENTLVGAAASFTGNVQVGGVLTYEDVTNIDSVGIVTARDGVVVVGRGVSITAGGLNVTAGVTTFSDDVEFKTGGTTIALLDHSQSRLEFQDNMAISFGNHPDVEIAYSNGNDFSIVGQYNGSGDLVTGFRNSSGNILKSFNAVRSDGSAELYFSNSKKLETTNTGVTVTGTVAATAVTGDGSGLSNVPAATPTNSDIQVVYTVTANGASAYRFAGNGVVSTADNPDIFLTRGVKYRFVNNSGGSHPFQIRESAGGSAYSTGVTNNGASSGNIDFAPTFDSPSKLVYQCTSHGGMVGNIYMTGGVGRWIQQSIVTLQSGSSYEFTDIPADVNEVMIVFDGLSFASGSNEIEFLLGHSGGYNTSNYIISASYEPGGNYQKRTTSIRFNGIGSSSYFPTGRLHLWKPVHNNNWWVEGICYPWQTEGEYQHRVTGTAPSGGTLSKIKIQGSAGANFDNTGNGKIQLSYIRY